MLERPGWPPTTRHWPLERHYSDFLLHFDRIHHHNRIPGTTIEEGSLRTLAGAFVAANAENRVHLDPTKGRMVLIWNPKHAVFHRAVFHAGRRTSAAGAAFCDYSQLFGFLFACGKEALGPGLMFELVGHHPDNSPERFSRHRTNYNSGRASAVGRPPRIRLSAKSWG